MRVGVDSCAGVSVWPKDLCDDVVTEETAESRAGVGYLPAGAGSAGIRDLGRRAYKLRTISDGRVRDSRFRVAEVRKPLLAVSEMNDAGLDVHFYADPKKGAFAVSSTSGEILKLERNRGVFDFEAEVMPSINSRLACRR